MPELPGGIKYGLQIVVTRTDVPGVELKVDMPEVGHEKLAAENPALAAVFNLFDNLYKKKL